MKKQFLTKKVLRKLNGILKYTKSARIVRRAFILKLKNDGFTTEQICNLGFACDKTIYNTLQRFEESGLGGALYDRPRSGQPRRFSKQQVTHIAAVVCSDPPKGSARWTLSLVKEYSVRNKIVQSISTETIRIMLISQDIKPWKHKMWCIPVVDDAFIKQMEEVLALYERPLTSREPVVCLDEKPLQLLCSPRRDKKRRGATQQDYEYSRNGVVNAFCAVEPKAGRHFVFVRKRKTAKDFAHVIKMLVSRYPYVKTIHVVMDNLSTHKEKSLLLTFGQTRGKAIWKKITPHYTPKHASWLNQAEIEINLFSRTCLGKIRVPDILALRSRSAAWVRRMNKNKVKFNWGFSRQKARLKFNYKTGKN